MKKENGTWSATDEEHGITARGESAEDALAELEDAISSSRETAGEDGGLGNRLRGIAGDIDVDAVEDVRETRE